MSDPIVPAGSARADRGIAAGAPGQTRTAPSAMARRARVFGAAALALLLLLVSAPARTAGPDLEQEAAAFLRSFSERAIGMLADDRLSDEARAQEFRRLLRAGFDMQLIGRTVLGRHWRTATEAQRTEFLRLFEDFVVLVYANRLGAYSGETLEVGAVRLHGDRDAVVRSRVLGLDAPEVTVDWRLRRSADGWRIIDVMVEGVSMTITHRSEFAAVISSSRNGLEGLLQKLRAMTGTAGVQA